MGTTKSESEIVHLVYGINIKITTEIMGPDLWQTYEITNNGDERLGNVLFADYFNYHPNGSVNPDHEKGTITYAGGTLSVTGINDGSFISDGSVTGERMDDLHAVGLAPVADGVPAPGDVINMVETRSYNGANDPLGPDDVGGSLAWELGDIGVGQSTSFMIHKTAVPEPETLGLLVIGGVLFLLRRRVN